MKRSIPSTLQAMACLAALALAPAPAPAQSSPTGLPAALNVKVTNTPLPVTGVVSGQVVATNSAANPLPTRDVGNPVRQPYSFFASCESQNTNSCQIAVPAVPAGTRLLLQHVNGSVQLLNATAQMQEFRLFVGSAYITLPPRQVNSFGGLVNFAINEPVLLFVEPGARVTVQVSSSELRLISSTMLSGYLVDLN